MKLSVIIPTYNRRDMVKCALKSVVSLAHRPLEVVIVDDGSTDQTDECIGEFKAICESSGVEFIFLRQENRGAAAARNTGLDNATGDLIQWVDADDTVSPTGVGDLVKVLINSPDVDIAYGLVNVVLPDGSISGVMGKRPTYSESDLFDWLWHTMAAVFRRTSLQGELRWRPELVLGDDWDFSSRARISGLHYQFVDAVVGNYVKHDLNRLTTERFQEDKCFSVIKAVLSIRGELKAKGKLTGYLQQRCFNRALVHAVELGAHSSTLAPQAYSICSEIGSPHRVWWALYTMLASVSMPSLHRIVFSVLRLR